MNSLYVIFAAILALSNIKSLTAEDIVQLQLYYESLCPGSRAFINDHLYKAFLLFGKERLDVELIPYGFASEEVVNGTKQFTCQHGPEECYGNKMDACAIDLATVEQSIGFVYCSESSDDPTADTTFQACAKKLDISWDDLQECLSSGKADDLLSAYGEETKLLSPTRLPTVVIDGTYSDENESAAVTNLHKLLCTLLENPTECSS